MANKCFRCGSEKLVKVVPAKALVIPEIKQEVEDGTAVVSCGCAGFLWQYEPAVHTVCWSWNGWYLQ